MIAGDRPGPTIVLRADMDALPLTEETELDFTSRIAGCSSSDGTASPGAWY